MAVVAGEITTTTYVHIPDIVRDTIERIGYTDASFGFDAQTCAVLTLDRPPVARHRAWAWTRRQGARRPGHDVRLRHATRPGS